MSSARGAQGYERAIERFVELSQSLRFEDVCEDFLAYLPEVPGRILDAGAGAGQNAAALDAMGHQVVAVEPFAAFLEAAQKAYPDAAVVWINDSLPKLTNLVSSQADFDLVLVDGVWHHLTDSERRGSLERFARLVGTSGRCALSLRNGPPGLGTCVYPTNVESTIRDAEAAGFECIFLVEDQPSILPGKEDVVWSRIVLEKK